MTLPTPDRRAGATEDRRDGTAGAQQPDDLPDSPDGSPTPGVPPTAFVAIDMQRVFGDAGSPWLAPRFDEVVPAVRSLADAARAAGREAVFTRFVAPAEPTGSWQPYYDAWPFALQPPDADLWDVVGPLADAPTRVVTATTFSKWPRLRPAVGTGPLVLAGVSTDCCVLSTALAAADDGAEVLVVADACAGVDDESHRAALHVMSLYAPLVRVVDLDTGLAALTGEGTGTGS